MAQENIDIVVKETGAENAKVQIKGIGEAATYSSDKLASFNDIVAKVTAGLGALGLSFGIKALIEAGDAYTDIVNRLGGVESTTKAAAKAEKELFDISQLSNRSFKDTVELYSLLRERTGKLGTDQEKLMNVVKNMTEAMDKQDKTGKGSADAMDKLFNAFENGRIPTQQLVQILQPYPELFKKFAEGSGVSTTRLRNLAKESSAATGQMGRHAATVGQVSNAHQRAGAVMNTSSISLERLVAAFGKANEDFGSAPEKVSEALEKLKEAFDRQVGIMDKEKQTTHFLAEAINLLAANMETLAPIVLAVGAGLTTFGVIAASTSGLVGALWAIVAAHPFALLAAALVIAVQLIFAFGNQMKLTADGSITLLGAMVGAFNFLVTSVKDLYTWVTTTTEGFASFVIALGVVTAAFVVMNASAIVAFFVTLAARVYAAAAAMVTFLLSCGPITLALVAVAAALAAVYVGYKLLTTGTFDMAAEFDAMKAKVLSWRDALVTSMKDASTATSDAAKEQKTWGDTIKTTTDESVRVVRNGTDSMSSDYRRQMQDLMGVGKAATDTATQVRNAMGEMVQVTSDWALRSGQYFNSVSASAQSMGSTVSSALSTASSTARPVSSGSSTTSTGPAGTGTPGGTFDFFNYEAQYRPIGGPLADQIRELAQIYKGYQHTVGANNSDVLTALRNRLKGNSNLIDETKFWRPEIASVAGFKYGGEFMVGGSSGVDSQLVQFLATPGERVKVETPTQQRQSNTRSTKSDNWDQPNGGQRPIYVSMTVVTPDAGSFRRSQKQTTMELAGKLAQATRGL